MKDWEGKGNKKMKQKGLLRKIVLGEIHLQSKKIRIKMDKDKKKQ